MLLPSLAKSREVAKRAVCTNNLKSANLGMQMLVDDGHGSVPSGSYPNYWLWFQHVGDYLNNKHSGWNIQGNNWMCPSQKTYPGPVWEYSQLHYGYTLWTNAWANSMGYIDTDTMGIGAVPDPSGKVIMAESDDDGSWDSLISHNSTYSVKAWHMNSIVSAFADGHVATVTQAVLQDSSTDPSIFFRP